MLPPTSSMRGLTYKNNYADTPIDISDYPSCSCFDYYYGWEKKFFSGDFDEKGKRVGELPLEWSAMVLHMEPRSNSQRALNIANEIILKSAKNGVKKLNLGSLMDRKDYLALNTLPDSIGELKDLETLILYGSNISHIPREICGCVNLRSFEPYTSYRLHWLPFEIKMCMKLESSCISTRALYGNYKLRPPFPCLSTNPWKWESGGNCCSICNTEKENLDQYWISQNVATDVVPLLVSVCSKECFANLGESAMGYVCGPHKGGLSLKQPDSEVLKMFV